MAKVSRAVHYAHEHGIVHRDIKPSNILFDQKGEPHLTDFGLARLVETESTVTRTLEVLGTPSYMAPEQAGGNNTKLSKATDVYGLGAVLYQLLAGRPPFQAESTGKTIRLVLETDPTSPVVHNPSVPPDLATICLKCLEKFRAVIASCGFLLEAFQANRRQIRWYRRIVHHRRSGIGLKHQANGLPRGLGLKRRTTREQLVEDRAKSINICGRW